MAQLTTEWFASYGFKDLIPEDEAALRTLLMDELEVRIGTRLSNMMTKEQFRAFERAGGSDEEQMAVLEEAVPDYKKIVDREFAAMGQEIQKLGNPQAVFAAFRK